MTLTQISTQGIKDGTITNADISSSAAIARTKLANVDLVDDTSPQLGGDLQSNGNDIKIADADKIKLGTDEDLSLYHNGSAAFLNCTTGDLHIRTSGSGDDLFLRAADDVRIQVQGTEDGIKVIGDGAVELYHDNLKKFETTSSGIAITGGLTVSGIAEFASTINLTHASANQNFIYFNEDLQFARNGTGTRLKIDSSGRVLIGTTSSNCFNGVGGEHTLIVAGSTADTDITDNSSAALTISNTDGTANNTAGLHFAREDNDGTPHYAGASIVAQFKETMNTGQYPKALLAFLTSTANNNAPSEKMRIDSDGAVNINTTSNPTINATGFVQMVVDNGRDGVNIRHNHAGNCVNLWRANGDGGLVHFYRGNTTQGNPVGSITVSSNSTGFNDLSDYRLKENVTAISDGITRLKTLKPSRFNFKDDKDTTVDGFLAHEVTLAVPEAITGNKDEVDKNNEPIYQQIDKSKLVPLLVSALQESIVRIEALETEVALLKAS
mgnify:CR=1 FL=1|tara:strand:- start:515 stop:2002 length:1488 start_codon:yes stop_codon:yes gene_type:complete